MPRRRVPVPLRWSDMDAYGHVNNVQFLRLLEDARVLGLTGSAESRESMLATGLLVARHEIDYLAPLEYRPDPVPVDLWVTAMAAASFELGYEVYDENPTDPRCEDGQPPEAGRLVYARAQSTMVTYDLAQNRPRRLTATERADLEILQDGPVAMRRRPR